MNFFKRKKKMEKPNESNEIANKELKEQIADAALQNLHENVEALFKVITDKTTAYFAVQGAKMLRLNFSEALFKTTVDGFLDLHQ